MGKNEVVKTNGSSNVSYLNFSALAFFVTLEEK